MTWVLLLLGAGGGLAAAARGYRRQAPDAALAPVDLSVHLARLHRLQEQRAREPWQGGIGLAARHTACVLAYDQVLLECAHALGIEAPALPIARPLPPAEQLHLEVELAARGLSW